MCVHTAMCSFYALQNDLLQRACTGQVFLTNKNGHTKSLAQVFAVMSQGSKRGLVSAWGITSCTLEDAFIKIAQVLHFLLSLGDKMLCSY